MDKLNLDNMKRLRWVLDLPIDFKHVEKLSNLMNNINENLYSKK